VLDGYFPGELLAYFLEKCHLGAELSAKKPDSDPRLQPLSINLVTPAFALLALVEN
jgi:hypothetical protein